MRLPPLFIAATWISQVAFAAPLPSGIDESLSQRLDQLNVNQNQVRGRIRELSQHQQELRMAQENLSLEVQKIRSLEKVHANRVMELRKLAYRIRRDGVFRFAVSGQRLSDFFKRLQLLQRTFGAYESMTQVFAKQSLRLDENEGQLKRAEENLSQLLSELKEQEGLLAAFLGQKRMLMGEVRHRLGRGKHGPVELSSSREMKSLFDTLSDGNSSYAKPAIKGLVAPVEVGRLLSGFGTSVHPEYRTTIQRKGIEIGAPHGTSVHAVSDGSVEFSGWVRGLGNVVILNHGAGVFSLQAHLYQSLVQQGARVKRGESIALVGDTGSTEQPSLYFELRHNSRAMDPLRYFDASVLTAWHAPAPMRRAFKVATPAQAKKSLSGSLGSVSLQ